MQKILVTFLMLSLSILSGPAWAYFTYEEGSGTSRGAAGFLSSGKDVPLDIAIRMIVPKGWSVDAPHNFAYPLVSWGGETDWSTAFAKVTAGSGCEFQIDEQGKNVALLCEEPSTSEAVAATTSPAAVAANVEPSLPLLVLQKGKSLKAQLEPLCKTNGYVLSWNYPKDIRLDDGLSMRCSFEEFLRVIVEQLRRNSGSRIGIELYTRDNPIKVVVKEF